MRDLRTGAIARSSRFSGIALAVAAALALGAMPAQGAVDAGVIGQWRFDEPDGQLAVDDGAHGLHGQLGTSELPDAEDPPRIAGRTGGAMRFDGSTFIRLPDAPSLQTPTLTVDAVVRSDATPGAYRYLLSRGSRGCFTGTYGLYSAATGGIAFYIFDGERYFVSATARIEDIWDGAWHSVSGVFDGETVRVFVDGRLVGEPLPTPPDTAVGYDHGPENTYVGTYVGTCTLPFVGDIDSVRIWSAGQTAQEVAANAGLQPVTAPPPAAIPAAETPAVLEPAPAALARSTCAVSVSRKTIKVRRRSVVTVRARWAGRPLQSARVAVRRPGQARTIAKTRTNSKGQARIALKVVRAGRLRVSLIGRSTCSPAYIKVARRG